MSEESAHLCITRKMLIPPANIWSVRWITEDDAKSFAEPFRKGGEHGWTLEEFRQLCEQGYLYCGVFIGKRLCSIAGVWKRADDVWETIAVGTREEYRRHGMAKCVVHFSADYILQHVKVASYTSRKSNIASIRTARSVGFEFCKNVVNNDKWCASNPRPHKDCIDCPLLSPVIE